MLKFIQKCQNKIKQLIKITSKLDQKTQSSKKTTFLT